MNIVIINTIQGMTYYVAINAIACFKETGDGNLMVSLVNGESMLTSQYKSAEQFFRTVRNIQRLDRLRMREN